VIVKNFGSTSWERSRETKREVGEGQCWKRVPAESPGDGQFSVLLVGERSTDHLSHRRGAEVNTNPFNKGNSTAGEKVIYLTIRVRENRLTKGEKWPYTIMIGPDDQASCPTVGYGEIIGKSGTRWGEGASADESAVYGKGMRFFVKGKKTGREPGAKPERRVKQQSATANQLARRLSLPGPLSSIDNKGRTRPKNIMLQTDLCRLGEKCLEKKILLQSRVTAYKVRINSNTIDVTGKKKSEAGGIRPDPGPELKTFPICKKKGTHGSIVD